GFSAARAKAAASINTASPIAAQAGFTISGLRQWCAGAAEPCAAATQHCRTDAARQWTGPLQLADQREQNEHVEEIIECRDLADGHHNPLRRVGPDPAECHDVDHQKPEHPFV